MSTRRSLIGTLLHDQAGDLAAEAVAAATWRGDPLPEPCPCNYVREFGHDPGCEFSPEFALAVDAGIEAAKHAAGEPAGHGDPTNPAWPDKEVLG